LKRIFLHIPLLFLLAGIFECCTTEKNTTSTRAYHNLTSRYNIYFNGKESLKAGLAKIDQGIDDDFTMLLPVYKENYTASARAARADMDNAILKASKLIQVHSITKKPKRQKLRTRRYQEFASKEEFNNWIDDSYLLIGEAYYYQHNFSAAAENFSYLLRKFPDAKTRYDAMVWLIRCYSQLDRYSEAMEIVLAMQSDRLFPKKLESELARATADMYIKQKEYPEAIKYLDICLKKKFSGKTKARLQYILAQLYNEAGETEKATEAYFRVRKFNPPYKMAFNARINAAGLFTGKGDPEKIKKELRKMLRDEKNAEFRDQIYFALANIYFREGDKNQAIDNFRKSVSASTDNNFQRALSSVTLADIYFSDMNYRDAQAYYDSALQVVNEEYPNFRTLELRYNSLTRLVENLTQVELQDSLQRIAKMPEKERNALINSWIEKEKEKQRLADLIANSNQNSSGFYQANEYRFGLGRSNQGAGWYFYNPQTVMYGKTQFQLKWGRRKLEDDWRRFNKSVFSGNPDDAFAELADSVKAVIREDDPLKKEFYTQDLPLNDSLMAISHEKIRDALYNAGKIFKSDFNDYPHSAKSYEDLNERYPSNMYLLSAWFDLYDLYELMGEHEKAREYRELIIQRFPGSKYARYLQNPNFFTELEARQDSLNRIYQSAFRNYKAGRYSGIPAQVERMKQLEPDTLLLPKIDFMDCIARGATSDMQNFEKLLEKYISGYPKAEPTPLAGEILKLIRDSTLVDYQKLVEMGYLHDEIRNDELQPGNQPGNDEFGGKFSYDEDLPHYFVILLPKSAKVDVNKLKFDIANYNLDHYTKYDFDTEEEPLDAQFNLLSVRSFLNKEQGLIYFRAIIRQPEVFRTLNEINYSNFTISSANYRQILSDQSASDYFRFFLKNYSRFTGPDFEREDQREESPEELMARAQREDDLLKERGKFVSVNVPVTEDVFSPAIDTTQSFVLAVMNKSLSLRPLMTQFADFNRNNFRNWKLAVQVQQAGEYQFMVVNGLPGYQESMSYFRQVILERTLFSSLGQTIYRNFIITGKNLERLSILPEVDSYMDFFRKHYILKAGRADSRENAQPPAKDQVSPGKTLSPSSETGYSGPYEPEVDQPHWFVMVVPREGFDKNDLLSQVRRFNEAGFNDFRLTVEELPLDDFRNILRVGELKDYEQAAAYMKKITDTRSVFHSLENTDYRNFIISFRNYDLFLNRKNITEYMDFYKKSYLEKQSSGNN
jgi:tetratricopeptide (TPR) repeat protein